MPAADRNPRLLAEFFEPAELVELDRATALDPEGTRNLIAQGGPLAAADELGKAS